LIAIMSAEQSFPLLGEPSHSVASKKSFKVINVHKEAAVEIQENKSPVQAELNIADKDTDEEKYEIEIELPDANHSKGGGSKENLQTSENQDANQKVSVKDNSGVKPTLNINAMPEPKNKNPSIIKP